MNKIASVFNDPSDAQANGLHFENNRYVYNKVVELGDIPVMHSISGNKDGIIAAKCKASILISHYPENSQAGDAVNFIHSQATYLIANNLWSTISS